MKSKLLITTTTLLICSSLLTACAKKEKLHISFSKDTVTLNKNGVAHLKMKTNSGAKYEAFDADNNKKLFGPKSTNNGNVDITVSGSGDYKIKIMKNGASKTKKLHVQPYTNKSTSKTKTLSFGNTGLVTDGNNIVSVQVNSAQKVDANNDMVTDISHNISGDKTFCIVTYKVSVEKGNISLDDFDGSEFTFLDDDSTTGDISSNRDNGIPDSLSKGENSILRIGIGLKNQSNGLTVKFGNLVWKGSIQ
ncbi:MAG: hypothetical protein ABF874_06315 [Liquorilactobacillus nagelii]|uniref:hypothetical protein n=1 Tax=Liquorilactobacillus nagelii TaxID=82688 RepID=UPI0039E82713